MCIRLALSYIAEFFLL